MQKIKSTLASPLLVLVVYVLLIASRYINIEALQYKDNIYLSIIILQMLIFILPGVFYCRIRNINIEENLRFKSVSSRGLWFIFSSFGVLLFGGTLINTATFYLFGNSGQYSLYNTFVPQGDASFTNIIYVVIAFAVLPALTEEFVFRGIVFSEYSSYGTGVAIFMSSLMFSMLHFNPHQFFIYFFSGIISAYVVYVTQSLFAAVLLHFVNNINAIFFESTLWDVIKKPNSIVFFIVVVVVLFAVFLILSLNSAENILYYKGIKGKKSPPEAQKQEGGIKLWFEALLSPGFLACIIFFIAVALFL